MEQIALVMHLFDDNLPHELTKIIVGYHGPICYNPWQWGITNYGKDGLCGCGLFANGKEEGLCYWCNVCSFHYACRDILGIMGT